MTFVIDDENNTKNNTTNTTNQMSSYAMFLKDPEMRNKALEQAQLDNALAASAASSSSTSSSSSPSSSSSAAAAGAAAAEAEGRALPRDFGGYTRAMATKWAELVKVIETSDLVGGY